jgi:hypothetical protein
VNLQVAKDQRLSLNPSQISGACGRLMCCLRYEHEFYVQSRKRFPKEGKILVTANGEEQVVSNDIFGDRVTLRNSEGDIRVVPLAELKAGMERRAAESHLSQRRALDESDDDSAPDADIDATLATDESLPGDAPSGELSRRRPSSLDERTSGERRPRRTRGRRGGRRHRTTDADSASPPTPRNRGRRPDRGEPEHPNED